MTATSFLMVMAMLAIVLGAMGVALRILRRYSMAGAAGKGSVKMEIIQRLTLGQRQGLAVVRIGTRVLAVSMGDGGVHQVAELTEADISTVASATGVLDAAPVHALANGIRRLALVGSKSEQKQIIDAGTSARGTKKGTKRISYVAPLEDFQAVLSMAMAGGAHA
ncbi:MAG: flagellar biosynthetic protein FliO [Gemmatimonadaceae bacterium]